MKKRNKHKTGDLVHWSFDGSCAIQPDQFLGIILKLSEDDSTAKVWWILTDHTNEMPVEILTKIEKV